MKFLFYRPLKITASEPDVCFWSDTHFNHRCERWEIPLWKARGFNSVEEHNDVLIQRWNKKANNNSVFFHLGDFIFGYDSVHHFKQIISQVKFKDLYVMPGNHNSGWKQVFEEQRGNVWKISDTKRVIFVPNYLEAFVNGQPIAMSHYPLASFNGQAKGAWMIHGHCHSNLYKSEIGPLLYRSKIIDVGIENSPEPITFKELKSFFKDRETITYDSHEDSAIIRN